MLAFVCDPKHRYCNRLGIVSTSRNGYFSLRFCDDDNIAQLHNFRRKQIVMIHDDMWEGALHLLLFSQMNFFPIE